MEAYVGVDWSASEIVCSTLTREEESPRKIRGARRTFADVQDLVHRVRHRHPEASEVHVVIESGTQGWLDLLHHAGAVVHVVDAKQAKAFAESLCSSGAKDDDRDSGSNAEMGRSRSHQLETWSPPTDLQRCVQEYTTMHETATHQRTQVKQRLRAHLKERFPRLEAVLDDPSRRWVFRLLRAVPTIHHAAELTEDGFMERMKGCGARKTTLATVWEAIRDSEAPWVTPDVAQAYAVRVRMWVDQLEVLTDQITELEAKLDEVTQDLEVRSLFESVDGIALKMSCRLIELVFDGEAPKNRDEASIKLGSSPVFRGSGKRRNGQPKGHVQMRTAASSRGRATAYLLGRLASQQLGWGKARHGYNLAQGKNCAHSYRIIARSLLRILTAMVKNGEPYDDAKYVAALKKHGVPWAAELPGI